MENKQENLGKGMNPGNLWIGVILVLGGVFILLNQMDVLQFELKWWAMFIFIPAAAALGGAYNRYRSDNNRISMGVIAPGLVGLFIGGFALSLLLGFSVNINWNLYWPFILILIGLGMVLGRK